MGVSPILHILEKAHITLFWTKYTFTSYICGQGCIFPLSLHLPVLPSPPHPFIQTKLNQMLIAKDSKKSTKPTLSSGNSIDWIDVKCNKESRNELTKCQHYIDTMKECRQDIWSRGILPGPFSLAVQRNLVSSNLSHKHLNQSCATML